MSLFLTQENAASLHFFTCRPRLYSEQILSVKQQIMNKVYYHYKNTVTAVFLFSSFVLHLKPLSIIQII